MQWLVNEVRAFQKEVLGKIESLWAENYKFKEDAAIEIEKLKGEIKAMKARMGKKKE